MKALQAAHRRSRAGRRRTIIKQKPNNEDEKGKKI